MNKQSLRNEYRQLDKKLTSFRKRWNAKAHKDLEYARVHHVSKGKQDDLPESWYRDVARWKQLRDMLGIRN